MNKNHEAGIAPLIIILVIAVLAISSAVFWKARNSNSKDSKTLTSMKSDLPSDLTGLLSVDKIKELALAEKSGATIKQVELEMINNSLVYKVQLLDGSLLAFNAKDGTKVELSSDEKSETEEDDFPTNPTITITFEKAVELAQANLPGKTVRKVELEVENGKVVYSVRFTDGSRVDVDASTGAINQSKDSLTEDKDKNDDGIDDDKETKTSTETSSKKVESKDSTTSSDDNENDDKDEDKIEYQKPESKDKKEDD